MPSTVYQRLQEYYKTPTAVKFTKTKVRRLSNLLAYIWDKDNDTVEYTESIEGEETFNVRLYPDTYVKIIDDFILRFERLIILHPQTFKRIRIPPQPRKAPIPEIKKERKKIVVKKPIYSTSKTIK